jgi:hypothetical protein
LRLKSDAIYDLGDALNCLGKLSRPSFLVVAVNKAAQLHDAVERLNIHIVEFVNWFGLELALDVGRDAMIVDDSAFAALAFFVISPTLTAGKGKNDTEPAESH